MKLIKELAHKGDPCVYCGIPHDQVAKENCPAFEDELRPPCSGDEFLGYYGRKIAQFDFTVQKFPIFKKGYKLYEHIKVSYEASQT
jgi:hypothetical protein